ncbi:MAG: hypothetical protein DMF88_11205 [Acidobacteria bacterium]|nr:MAG: hypothetical protein DMF88_11205 [Acidobacteriota bacterium]
MIRKLLGVMPRCIDGRGAAIAVTGSMESALLAMLLALQDTSASGNSSGILGVIIFAIVIVVIMVCLLLLAALSLSDDTRRHT